MGALVVNWGASCMHCTFLDTRHTDTHTPLAQSQSLHYSCLDFALAPCSLQCAPKSHAQQHHTKYPSHAMPPHSLPTPQAAGRAVFPCPWTGRLLSSVPVDFQWTLRIVSTTPHPQPLLVVKATQHQAGSSSHGTRSSPLALASAGKRCLARPHAS